MAVVNPYDPGTPVPLPTYTGSLGDWRAMMEFEPWKDLIRQEVTFNPQWLPDLPGWIKKEAATTTLPVVKTTVAGNGTNGTNGINGTNGTNGNGTNGTNGILTGINGNGDIIDLGGVVTGDVSAIDQGLADAQAAAAAQALLDEEAAAQALIDQQAADALSVQQTADAKAAADALLEQQRLEDERIRQEQADEAALQELIRQEEEAAAAAAAADERKRLRLLAEQEAADAKARADKLAKETMDRSIEAALAAQVREREREEEERARIEAELWATQTATPWVDPDEQSFIEKMLEDAAKEQARKEAEALAAFKKRKEEEEARAKQAALQFDLNYLTGISPSSGPNINLPNIPGTSSINFTPGSGGSGYSVPYWGYDYSDQ